jgi:uncharacterized protein involved in outer membrane biogenesis
MQGGSMSDLALRLANLDLANAAAAAAKGDQPIAVRCLVADLPAREGVLETRRLLLDTEHTLLVGTGHIDLRDEALALRVVAEPKDPSLLSLRGPIRVEGTFADPQVRPELANALARIGAAAALGAVAWLVQRGLEEALGLSVSAQVIEVGAALLAGSVVYAAVVLALRVEEARYLQGLVLRRFGRTAS